MIRPRVLTIHETIRRDPTGPQTRSTLRSVRTRLFVGLAAAALTFAACGGDDAGGTEDAAVSPEELLSFRAQTVSGDEVDVSDYAGSDLVLWFWAPW